MERKPEPHDLLVALLQTQAAIERRSDSFFQPFGLTSAQFNILNLLAMEDGRMEQLVLVDALLVGKSSISIVINRMVRAGLIRREDHPKDRRQVVLLLTPKGRKLWQKIAPTYVAGVKQIFGVPSPLQRQRLIDGLHLLTQTLQTEESDSRHASESRKI